MEQLLFVATTSMELHVMLMYVGVILVKGMLGALIWLGTLEVFTTSVGEAVPQPASLHC